jgi:hypothetical protein
MTEKTPGHPYDPYSVRKVMTVQAPRSVAWRVFTEQMGVNKHPRLTPSPLNRSIA